MNDLTDNHIEPAERGGYALSNAAAGGADVLRCLAEMLDEDTTAVLRPLNIAAGDHCLELGPGAGTIARWLASLVGPGGNVTAVDLQPEHIARVPGLVIEKRDLRIEPLPVARKPWQLIFGRLFFAHLPNRLDLLRAAVAALAPGGWFVTADWAGVDAPAVMYRCRLEGGRDLFERYQTALMEHVFAAAGTDTRWYVEAGRHMRRAGLVNVGAVQRARVWYGGQPGCELPIHVSRQTQQTLIDKAGFTAAELDYLRTVLADDRTMIGAQPTWFTIGHRPVVALR